MKIARRLAVVATCYFLSSYGIVLSLMLVAMSGTKSLCGALVGLVMLFAWVCHIVMSANWVIDRPARKWVPVYGTLAGIIGMALWPIADTKIKQFEALDVFRATAIGAGFTLPCVLLAVYLVRFHLKAQSKLHARHVS